MSEKDLTKVYDDLDQDGRDIAVVIAKGLFGAIPGIGSGISEIVGYVIPKQRQDRVIDFVKKLAAKVEDHDDIIQRMQTPEGADLSEEAMLQASRAHTDARREYIASLLENSLNKNEMEHDEKKKLFNLLSQLNDHEIIFLKYYSLNRTLGSKHPFFIKHYDILEPVRKTLNRSEEDSRKDAFRESYKDTLLSLRLIQSRGDIFSTTPLGNLLLNYIQVPDEVEPSGEIMPYE